jgi:hypothetical protein
MYTDVLSVGCTLYCFSCISRGLGGFFNNFCWVFGLLCFVLGGPRVWFLVCMLAMCCEKIASAVDEIHGFISPSL